MPGRLNKINKPDSVASLLVPNNWAVTGASRLSSRSTKSLLDQTNCSNLMKQPPNRPTRTENAMIATYVSARFQRMSWARAEMTMLPIKAFVTPILSAVKPTAVRPMAIEKLNTAVGATDSWAEMFGSLSPV